MLPNVKATLPASCAGLFAPRYQQDTIRDGAEHTPLLHDDGGRSKLVSELVMA